MTEQEFLELVQAGERPGVEFKNPRERGDRSFPEVVRAVLGMTNRRDGGVILIGVEDDGTLTGLSEAQAASWQHADHVRQSVAPYADPYAYVDVVAVTLMAGDAAGRTFVAIRVHEFAQVPVLCARAAMVGRTEVLRLGACYVRSRQMPATTEVVDHPQLRELLDLAIEKGVRDFLQRARRAGLERIEAIPEPADVFRQQRENWRDE